ncbi:MAG: hypothetical protein JWR06_2175 [Jatrophihabitans sp.]|nr:hypothetical protein [Jatrophihabitans sp.]MDT4902272.1 hypothetical protein [Pseudonocardiales bacterium]MDT4950751.1 hypothetical protein [Pseudonocardiales bacterium]
MRFRYFDPMQQSVIEGELSGGAHVAELVGVVTDLRADCSPALELAGRDGSSLVLGIARDRAVVLWTTADGTTRHSVGGHGEHVMFDYFGACTQVPGNYTVPLTRAVDAAGGYVDGYPATMTAPGLPFALD